MVLHRIENAPEDMPRRLQAVIDAEGRTTPY